MNHKTRWVTALGGAAFAAAVTGFGIASAVTGQAGASSDPVAPTGSFATNAAGQTYGALHSGTDGVVGDDEIPDLVQIVGNHGVVGYAYENDVLGSGEGDPSTPEEALAWQAHAKDYEIPVYAADGTTVVDTFTVLGPAPELANEKRADELE